MPQFSLRWILALTAAMALVSLVVSQGLKGQAWAAGISIGLLALALIFIVYAAMFGAVWLIGEILTALRTRYRKRTQRGDGPYLQSIAPTDKILPVLALAISMALGGRAALGASGGSVGLPILGPGQVNTTGLALTLDTSWVDSNGYRPVRIVVQSLTGPVKADRVLTLRFSPKQNYILRTSLTVSQVIEIPAGAASATATISVPQFFDWGLFELETFEDGQKVEQLCTPPNSIGISTSGANKGDAASPVILSLNGGNLGLVSNLGINGAEPELVVVGGPWAQSTNGTQISRTAATNGLVPIAGAPIPSLGDLPTHWIDYSGIDVVVTSLETLKTLKQMHPAQAQAIHDWLRNGGTLFVYGVSVGLDWEDLEQVERLAGFADDDRANPKEFDPAKRGWILPHESLRRLSLLTMSNANSGQTSFPAVNATPSADGDSPTVVRSDFATAEKAPFVIRQSGLGIVAAIRSDAAFTGNNFNWPWLYNSIGPERWQWHQRWGVSLNQPNDDFYNFLIPGVGLAPVLQFQILITLFVLVIGPVNYFLLRRWGKLNLTVLTVPAGALAITGALMLYALIADGLSVRVRARSFTHIDQRSGQAVCWSRLSYYAGLAPSGGLTFSDDTAVVPLFAQPGEAEADASRDLDWTRTDASKADSPLKQNLTDGWLNARTPTQFITARVRKTSARLEIKSAGDGKSPAVVNHLGTPIKWLMMIDEDGKCFSGEKISPDAATPLTAVESQSSACTMHWQPILAEHDPQRPDGMVGGNRGLFGLTPSAQYNQNVYGPGYVYRMAQQNNNGSAPTTQSSGTLERELRDITDQMLKNQLPPRTYVAIVELSPEMELGTSAAHEEASLHVIRGEW